MENDTVITAEEISKNLQNVQEKMDMATRNAGRLGEAIRLVVVTKTHPVEMVQMAVEAGARWLGENYAEEGISKKAALKSDINIQWHMIGHIQSRKARIVAEHYDYVHSLDSVKLASKLSGFAHEFHRTLPVLLECNVSGEASKFGFSVWEESRWSNILPEITQIANLPNLKISGLMTMAPYFDDPELARPIFKKLKKMQEYLMIEMPHVSWKELSMGMSADYEIAIQEGATIVRIGQAILGSRYYC
jgi:pyridoxal phosphate enzyme (YggS family)